MCPVPYSERLSVPLRWWVQATMFLASVWLAFVVALPAAVAWAGASALALLVFAVLAGYGAAAVRVSEDGVLHAGRATIPVRLLGETTVLDAEATRLTAGREADARAFLLLRPYLKRAVRISVADPADPTPYWLVATRHPDELAAALRRVATTPDEGD